MDNILSMAEKLIAVLGIVLCIVAGALRLAGNYHVAGFEILTLFIIGIGAMQVAVLMKLHLQS